MGKYADCCYEIARCYENGTGGVEKDELESIRFFEEAANHGHVDAALYLGDYYFDRRGITHDSGKAFAYYLTAALNDSSDGLYEVGRFYEYGIGPVKTDYEKAYQYNEKAAGLKSIPAKNKLKYWSLHKIRGFFVKPKEYFAD